MAKKKKVDQDTVYHNTLLLLKRYRDVVWSLTVAVEQVKHDFHTEYGKDIDEFLDTIYAAGADLCGTEIEERAKSIARSNKMLKYIDNAVATMRQKNKNGEIYYQVIYYNYLTPHAYRSNDEVTEALCNNGYFMCRKTMTTYRAEAVECIGSLLWGYTSRDCQEILEHFVHEEE